VIQHQLSGNSASNIQTIAGAYNTAFWWSIGFAVIAVIPTLLLSMRKNEPAANA
jgi:hypothetical protein